ncbi:hypothetical protein ACF0H5_008875 [Mactra antiquata]
MEPRRRNVIIIVFVLSVLFIIGIFLAVFLTRENAPHDEISEEAPFDSPQAVAKVTSHYVTEASGICASRRHADVLYTHNDSGDKARIYAINAVNGLLLAVISIKGIVSKDWEDIACGPCTNNYTDFCIYIADTGGNAGGNAYTIFRIKEPAIVNDQTVELDSFLKFSWWQYDCETIMVDPTGEVYVVSKVCAGSHALFQLVPSSAWGLENRTWVTGAVSVPITSQRLGPVGGDMSPDGREILLKTYESMYYWNIADDNYYEGIQKPPKVLPYREEPLGEAVGFALDGSGYYTLSEGTNATLYFYKRAESSVSDVIDKKEETS